MIIVILSVLAGICTICIAVIAVIAYQSSQNNTQARLWDMRIKSYNNIMKHVIKINKTSVDLDEQDRYEVEKNKYVTGTHSEYDELMQALLQSYQQSYFIISEEVKASVGEYIDYMSKSKRDGPQIKTQLLLTGDIVKAMRKDLGLGTIFPDADQAPGS